MAIDGALTMKRVLRFSVGLHVNLLILFILVKLLGGYKGSSSYDSSGFIDQRCL